MPKNNIKQERKGFTIIEVVLVLAIAGLIFLMVFVALPALQRSQRDTARRNDMSRVDTSLVQYQTNHSSDTNNLPDPGQTPSKWTATEDFQDGCANQGSEDGGSGGGGSNTNSTLACTFVRDYMNTGASETNKKNEFQDPDGEPYNMIITPNWGVNANGPAAAAFNEKNKLVSGTKDGQTGYTIGGDSPFSEHVVYIVPGARCSGEYVLKSEKRHFAVLYRLEGAGVYCIDDQ